jgi:hypothetical protein
VVADVQAIIARFKSESGIFLAHDALGEDKKTIRVSLDVLDNTPVNVVCFVVLGKGSKS